MLYQCSLHGCRGETMNINEFPYFGISAFPSGGAKPKKQHKRRQKYKGPLTRKQRIRQQIREWMLQAKAAIIEV